MNVGEVSQLVDMASCQIFVPFAFMHYFDLRCFSGNFNSRGHHPLGSLSSLISRFQLPILSLTNRHHSHQSSIHYLVPFYQHPINLNNKPASQFQHHQPVITHPHAIVPRNPMSDAA